MDLVSIILREDLFLVISKMGMRNDDIIQGVNGKKIKTVDDVMPLFQQFNSVSEIVLEIKRRGKPMTMLYQLW